MQTLNLTLNNELGLHARPASIFVKTASKYKSDMKVIKDKKSYNGKSIIDVLSLGAIKGTEITIVIDGEDEMEAVSALKTLIENKFID